MNWFELITVFAVLCRFDNTLWLACNALSSRQTCHSKAAEGGAIYLFVILFQCSLVKFIRPLTTGS